MRRLTISILAAALLLACQTPSQGIGSRVFVVERASGSLAIYDYVERKLLPQRITGLGDLSHATMIFSPDLRYGYLATRGGEVSRIDLHKLERTGVVQPPGHGAQQLIGHFREPGFGGGRPPQWLQFPHQRPCEFVRTKRLA